MISLILAMDQNGGIGYRGHLPWHIKSELAFFRNATMGATLIMGRKTFDGIGKPLPGRKTIVVSSNPDLVYPFENVTTATSLQNVLEEAQKSSGEYFVAGGKSVYQKALKYAKRIYLTRIGGQYTVDTFWRENFTEGFYAAQILRYDGFSVYVYDREDTV